MQERHVGARAVILCCALIAAGCGDDGAASETAGEAAEGVGYLEGDPGFGDRPAKADRLTGDAAVCPPWSAWPTTTPARTSNGQTVGQLIAAYRCSTAPTMPLNRQIAAQMNCIEGGFFAPIDHIPNVWLGSAAAPVMQAPAAAALARAAAALPDELLELNSTWRSVVQQYILKSWEGSCGIGVAARPGTSNHEAGLAIDLPSDVVSKFKSALRAAGWTWYCDVTNRGRMAGCRDIPHWSYRGADLRSRAVKAFQQLWNHANPHDAIDDDGIYGGQTEARLRKAPVDGFAAGPTCGDALADCPPLFGDVAVDDPARGAVEDGYQAGLWLGCASGTPPSYCPAGGVTRATLAVVAGRAACLVDGAHAEGRFADLAADDPAAAAAEVLVAKGIMAPCDGIDDTFCPTREATRGEVAITLARAAALDDAPPTRRFEDLPADHPAAGAIAAIDARSDADLGCGDRRFCADLPALRGELAVLVKAAFAIPDAPAACR